MHVNVRLILLHVVFKIPNTPLVVSVSLTIELSMQTYFHCHEPIIPVSRGVLEMPHKFSWELCQHSLLQDTVQGRHLQVLIIIHYQECFLSILCVSSARYVLFVFTSCMCWSISTLLLRCAGRRCAV